MERSAEISSACYQVEGIRQSSRGRLHLYYLAYNYTRETNPKNESGDITLVAQLSIDRLGVSLIMDFHMTEVRTNGLINSSRFFLHLKIIKRLCEELCVCFQLFVTQPVIT